MRILFRSSRKADPFLPVASSDIAAPLAVLAVTARLIRVLDQSGRVLLLIVVFLLSIEPLAADPVEVNRTQGTFHGFLVLKTPEGKTLANGDLVQVAHGDRVTSRLTFHSRDGSLDDDVAIYSQHKIFELISDHHSHKRCKKVVTSRVWARATLPPQNLT